MSIRPHLRLVGVLTSCFSPIKVLSSKENCQFCLVLYMGRIPNLPKLGIRFLSGEFIREIDVDARSSRT